MIDFIDTSVLVGAVLSGEEFHRECDALLDLPNLGMYAHGLAETFSTLTGGRRQIRMPAEQASELLEEDYVPLFTMTSLTPNEMLRAMRDTETRGVRGGAIFDYLHLVAARKAKARRLYSLNVRNFIACWRDGDPEIVHPGKV